MVSKLIEKNNTYFCSNCLMRQPRIQENCFWCGNMFSNYEDMLIKDINDHARALLDINPETGRDEDPEIIIGDRWWEPIEPENDAPLVNDNTWNKLVEIIRRQNK